MKRFNRVYNKMIKIIKKLPLSFTPQILASAKQNRSHPTSNPTGLQQLNFKKFNSLISFSHQSCKIPYGSYPFSTQKTSTTIYQKTSEQAVKKQEDTSNIQPKIEKAYNFLNRLRQYSNFLNNKQNKSSSTFLSTNKIQQKLIEDINSHFKTAGTSKQQISKSLQDIANKLQNMLKQTQNVYNQHLNDKQEQLVKYNRQYNELIKIIINLDQNYFKQPLITSVQPIQAALFLLDLQTKLSSAVQLLYGAIQESKPYFSFTPDIANDDPYSKSFKYAWDKVKIIQLDQSTKKNHNFVYNLLKKSVIMVTNAVVTQHTWSKWNNQIWHKMIFGLSFPFSLADLQKAQLKCYKLWRNPTIKMVMNLLDLPQKGLIQHAKKVIYPSIKSNFFLYHHSAPKSTKNKKQSVKSQQIKAKQTNINIFQKSEHSGRILLLANQNLNFKTAKPTQKFEKLKNMLNLKIFKKQQVNSSENVGQKQMQTIIIHMHGGGFISMSSQLMQNHTRVWANQLQIPVFSLDYRKPPKHRFPQPLQDCVAGYKFIVQKIHQHMNIRPKNIILAGDSAGGNMACALQAYLMKQKYHTLPKAMLLMYPATDLRIRYTPSRLHSFSDGIFLPSLLMLCQKQYLGSDPKTQFDPLASPILLTEGYINPQKQNTKQNENWPKQWPKTVIMSGRKDPLFDDSIRLLERLTRDNIDCKMLLYKDFSHGFMSMDQALPGCKQAIQDSITELKQIVKSF